MKFDPVRFLLAFFDALLRSPMSVTACDVAGDLNLRYDKRSAKQVGPIVKSLADNGLIAKVGVANSRRKPRNGGLLTVWAAIRLDLIKVRRDSLATTLQRLETKRPETQLTFPGFDSTD